MVRIQICRPKGRSPSRREATGWVLGVLVNFVSSCNFRSARLIPHSMLNHYALFHISCDPSSPGNTSLLTFYNLHFPRLCVFVSLLRLVGVP